jgi:hypothetical protein
MDCCPNSPTVKVRITGALESGGVFLLIVRVKIVVLCRGEDTIARDWQQSLPRYWRTFPGAHMSEQEFQAKLAELMGEISTLPPAEREKLEQLASETRQRHERLAATVSGLQESLDYLRLSIKYLVFDLEATRRENNYLRKILEEGTSNEPE